jgi:hypothetical protein
LNKKEFLWQYNFVDWENKTYYCGIYVKMPDFFSILTKVTILNKFFMEISNLKFQVNPSIWRCADMCLQTDRQTDGQLERQADSLSNRLIQFHSKRKLSWQFKVAGNSKTTSSDISVGF